MAGHIGVSIHAEPISSLFETTFILYHSFISPSKQYNHMFKFERPVNYGGKKDDKHTKYTWFRFRAWEKWKNEMNK